MPEIHLKLHLQLFTQTDAIFQQENERFLALIRITQNFVPKRTNTFGKPSKL